MITYNVQVTFRGAMLLNEFADSLSEAHMLAKDVGVVDAVVEIWEGFVGADTWFIPDQLVYSYKLDKED